MNYPLWNEPGVFYVLNLNGITKFGITQHFEKRMKSYIEEYQKSGREFAGQLCYVENYNEFWKLEFTETILKRTLYPYVAYGYEYIDRYVPTENVIQCYKRIKEFLDESNKYNWIKEYHTIGRLRSKLYKLFYLEHKEVFDSIVRDCIH